jgi:hypothetical protein
MISNRRVASFLLATILLPIAARAETYMEPRVFDASMGPFTIEGYATHTSFIWATGSGFRSIDLAVPFHALVVGVAVGVTLLGLLIFLRRRLANRG